MAVDARGYSNFNLETSCIPYYSWDHEIWYAVILIDYDSD